MSVRPEILILSEHYLPGYRAGGPVRAIANMVDWLGDDFNFKILTSDHDLGSPAPYQGIHSGIWQSVGKASVRYLTHKEQRLQPLRHLLNETSYELLYLDGAFAPMTLKALLLRRLCQIPRKPLVIAPRGHLYPSALSIKSPKKRFFLYTARLTKLYGAVVWHASTEAESNHIRREFKLRRTSLIGTLAEFPRRVTTDKLAQKPAKRSGELHMIFLSRIVRVKNLRFVLDNLRGVKGQINFDVYGPLEDERYWQDCQSSIQRLPSNVAMRYCGEVSSGQVTDVLTRYHLFVLPTLGENFGHVIFEALSAGCPVLISDQTPWSEINLAGAGRAVPLNQAHQFQRALQNFVDADARMYCEFSTHASDFSKRYIEKLDLMSKMKDFFLRVIKTE